MAYRLSFPDRYQLWNTLLRGNADRIFIPTDIRPPIGCEVEIEIHLEDGRGDLSVRGIILGRRGFSRRFKPGVFVRIDDDSVRACQAELGLGPLPEIDRDARRSLRVNVEVPARFLLPEDDVAEGVTKNISQTGVFIVTELALSVGQLVHLELGFPERPLEVQASVAWCNPGRGAVGLKFTDLSPGYSEDLRDHIAAAYDRFAAGSAREPKPILVVDCDRLGLEMISEVLVHHGYEVFQASTGQEALELIQQLNPSLVILDILLPEVDGAELCKVMRADAEWADIPVLFVSALQEESLASVAAEAGATDYLIKPLNLGDLINLVQVYLPAE